MKARFKILNNSNCSKWNLAFDVKNEIARPGKLLVLLILKIRVRLTKHKYHKRDFRDPSSVRAYRSTSIKQTARDWFSRG